MRLVDAIGRDELGGAIAVGTIVSGIEAGPSAVVVARLRLASDWILDGRNAPIPSSLVITAE